MGENGKGKEMSLQAVFSRQKLSLKSPSEHSGKAQKFTNQFAKLAWLEITFLCIDPNWKAFLSLLDSLRASSTSAKGQGTP